MSDGEAGEAAEREGGYVEGRVFLVTTVFLAALVLAAGIAGYLVPAGQFVEGDAGPVYAAAEAAPVPWWGILAAPVLVLGGANGPKLIVLSLFILLIGGSFSILDRGGILPTLLRRLAHRFAERRRLFLVINATAFALLGSTLGVLEELVPLILLYVPLARRYGWDARVGMAIPFLSSGFGFAAATFNPFTVGTAQRLAGLPLFSGVGLRAGFLAVTISLVVGFLLWRTRGAGEVSGPVQVDGHPPPPWLGRVVAWLLACMAAVVAVVLVGARVPAVGDLAFPLIALVFVVMGVGGGLLAGVGGGRVGRLFGRGLEDFAPAILLILLAGSVGHLLTEGRVLPTLLAGLAETLSGWSTGAAAVGIYVSQMLINLAVPSGTGQAVLTIPVLAPLGDLIGLSRQTVVLAFQCGDGFSNMLWPTNPLLLIALGLAGVSWRDWFRWILPLQVALFAASVAVLLLAVAIGYA